MMPLLIADDVHPCLMQGLQDAGIPFDYQPGIKPDEVLSILHNYQGLVVRSKLFVDRRIMEAAPGLKFIARAGSGMDNIEMAAALERGIHCLNAPEGNADAVGEHATGLLLSLIRKIPFAFEEVKQGIWKREENRGEELNELVVGIVGFGHTGSAFARKISGFGCQVMYYDKNPDIIPTPGAIPALMGQLLEQADVLSFHVPLDEMTRGMINKSLIDNTVKPFYLLNLSRGGIMNTRDVLSGLEQGKIRAAALDVLENENPASWNAEEASLVRRLTDTGRVIITPHIGGWTIASYRKISEVLLRRILGILGAG